MESMDLLNTLATKIVAAYVSNNAVAVSGLPNVIMTVRTSLAACGGAAEAAAPTLIPAVAIKKSIAPDYIICLEDGKKLKMLKRYLRTQYSTTPEEYRAKWGLPHDYPMVAPTYAANRSAMAKAIGLGRKKVVVAPEPVKAKGERKKAVAVA
jgi:predicted transcriptional regulator